jgi:TnpA family transposase
LTRALRPLVGVSPLAERFYPTLLAALVAHGTNLGMALMGESTEGITVDMLHEVSHACLRTDTVKRANTALVDSHHHLTLRAVWGDGTVSSSDGQRFGLEASSLLASLYPRYFGYYDRAIPVYTHLSDQYEVFATQAISCTPREAL